MSDEPRLSRQEAHDLSMLIKDRSKVLKAHAEELKSRHNQILTRRKNYYLNNKIKSNE